MKHNNCYNNVTVYIKICYYCNVITTGGVSMSKVFWFCIIVALFLVSGISYADMTVLTFDDIVGYDIPNGYGGLNWDNMYTVNASSYPGTGYYNGMVSPDRVAYNGSGYQATVIGEDPFDFGGVYMTSAWVDGLNVTVTGYLGSSQLYTQTVIIDDDAPAWFTFNYSGIDKLVFSSYYDEGIPSQIVMDNFTLGIVPGTEPEPVPVPGAVLLGIFGLSAAGIKLRKHS